MMSHQCHINYRRETVLLYQSPEGYCYNSDSIFLYDFICGFSPKGRLLDIGCGVGILSLLLGRDFDLEITAVDKQPSMLSYAAHNFRIHDIGAETVGCDIATYAPSKHFDFVISNPPFYDSSVTQSQNSHLNAARYAQHMPIEVLVQAAKRVLTPRGYFLLCYDAKQVDLLLAHLKEAKINPEVLRFVHPKSDREAKIVLVAARAGSKSMTKVLPPLVVFDENSHYLPEPKRAFERANTHSIKAKRDEEESSV